MVRDAVKLPRHPDAPYPAGLKSAANSNHAPADAPVETPAEDRSEEHTSELQSLMRISYAVFCLKKKKQKSQIPPTAIKTIQINIHNNQHITQNESTTTLKN